jgi:aspartate kinase
MLASKKINVDIILQSIGRDNTKDVSFTVSENNLDTALALLNESLPTLRAREVIYDKNISKVSIVGAGMATNAGVAAKMFEALYDAGINIQMISTSEIKISVLIERGDAERAVKVIHEHFNLNK